jgi:hypothetical protein
MLLLSSIPSGTLLPGRHHRIREDVPSADEMNIDVESDYNRRVDEELAYFGDLDAGFQQSRSIGMALIKVADPWEFGRLRTELNARRRFDGSKRTPVSMHDLLHRFFQERKSSMLFRFSTVAWAKLIRLARMLLTSKPFFHAAPSSR